MTTCVKYKGPPITSRSCTQRPSTSRRKGFSRSSSELSSSKGVWLPRKFQENEGRERKKKSGKLEKKRAESFCAQNLLIESLYRLRLIYAQNKGKLQKKKKKNQDQKVLEGIKWEENQKYNKNIKASKSGEQCLRGE